MQARQVPGEVVQQVPEHLVAEPQSATFSLCPQMERLFGVREGLELVDQAPGEPGAEIFTQWQLGRWASARRTRRGSQQVGSSAARFAPQVDDCLAQAARRELPDARQRLDVCSSDVVLEAGLGRRRDL